MILVAPKGSGTSVRANFLDGSGINSSFAVDQDSTGRARERTLALGIAIGSGYLFPTTFQNEVYSDLTGERGVLMGALAGVMEAQYQRPAQARPLPQRSLQRNRRRTDPEPDPPGGQNGMDWMYANCTTTAQRGALDWRHDSAKPSSRSSTACTKAWPPAKRPASSWKPTAPLITRKNWTPN